MPENVTFLTTEQAARMLSVHPNTILRWIKKGKLPSSQIGKQYRIPREAIENQVSNRNAGTRIIAVANQKGGVAQDHDHPEPGRRPGPAGQAGAGRRPRPPGRLRRQPGHLHRRAEQDGLHGAHGREQPALSDVILKTPHGFDLAPSNIDLAGAEVELKQLLAAEQILKRKLDAPGRRLRLHPAGLRPQPGHADHQRPDRGQGAAHPHGHGVPGPARPGHAGQDGEPHPGHHQPRADLPGHPGHQVRPAHAQQPRDLRGAEGGQRRAGIRLFNVYITHSVRFAESPNSKAPLILVDPEHEGSKAYAQVVEEIIHE